MTTEENEIGPDMSQMQANLAKIETLSQRLIAALGQKKQVDQNLQAPGNELYLKATGAYMAGILENPARVMEHQVSFWAKSLELFAEAQAQLGKVAVVEPDTSSPADKRFTDPLWDTHPYFRYVKKQYLHNSEAIHAAVHDVEGLSDADKKRLEYFSGQIVDMFSPNNFLATNPAALERAIETDGQSLVDGLENLVRDVEENHGEVVLSLADKDAFRVGENLATTPGAVVYRNRMFELLQYEATTEKIHARPLIIFPPWINKFYILDLKDQNSLIKWIVDQGFTLFVVSWVNPDPSYSDVGMEEYVEEGYLRAIEEVKQITGQKQVNTVGYCIAGATLALTLSLMKKRGDTSIASATFFTTLTDFADQGEVGVFLDNDFMDAIERQVEEDGVLKSFFMSRTFSYLRSNDLIYGPAIRSYMMGQPPPAFDLLYWNGDGTNLPAKMAVEYLRQLCQDDLFAKGKYPLFGEMLDIKDVSIPLCSIACETDHIAAWKSCLTGVKQMGSKDRTFILSQSGHVAGIVNPPSRKKYGHYTNVDLNLSPDEWYESAEFHEGSWWGRWAEWLATRSGKQIPARKLGDAKHPVLCAAPGTYVVSDVND